MLCLCEQVLAQPKLLSGVYGLVNKVVKLSRNPTGVTSFLTAHPTEAKVPSFKMSAQS